MALQLFGSKQHLQNTKHFHQLTILRLVWLEQPRVLDARSDHPLPLRHLHNGELEREHRIRRLDLAVEVESNLVQRIVMDPAINLFCLRYYNYRQKWRMISRWMLPNNHKQTGHLNLHGRVLKKEVSVSL